MNEESKVMTAREAVEKFVFDGATIGLGGQNVGRMAMAAVHEIVRQGKKDLTICGCNLSINMDILVGAGLVKRCEAETGPIAPIVLPTPLSVSDPRLQYRAVRLGSLREVLACLLQKVMMDVGFVGGAEIDQFGNINTTVTAPTSPLPAISTGPTRGPRRA